MLSKNYCAVVYPESFDIQKFRQICDVKDFRYVYVLHDKDVNKETGELKKAHYHVIVDLQDHHCREEVFQSMGFESNQYRRCRDVQAYINYMSHNDEEDKFVYGLESIEFSYHFRNIDEVLQYYQRTSSASMKSAGILEDVIKLSNFQMSLKEFVVAHPESIYRMNQIEKLMVFARRFERSGVESDSEALEEKER